MDASIEVMQSGSPPEEPRPPRSKRGRLSLACTQCRKRKVRCDATTPKCRNCVLRGDECKTFDPRRPNGLAVRKWPIKSSVSPTQRRASESQASQHSSPGSLASAQQSTTSFPRNRNKERHPSWIERAYQESHATPEDGTDGQTNDSPDVAMNTDESSHRIKYMGSSSLQCLTRFLDLCFERRGLESVGSHFRWGMCFTEEYSLPLILNLPDLPGMTVMEPWINIFFSRTHPLIPVLDRTAFRVDMLRFSEMQLNQQSGYHSPITSTDAPALVAVYAVLTIGKDDYEGTITPSATTYLTAAYSLVSHLLSFPYMSSVQALVLLAVAMRARGKEGQCWHLLGQAIRIGYSVGFHRRIISDSTDHTHNPVDRQLHSQIWWACFALEKSMQLETGRPSVIDKTDGDQPPPDKNGGLNPYFIRWVSLADIFGKISEHIFQHKHSNSYAFLSGISQLDQELVDWLEETPDNAKLGHSSTSSSENRAFALFLSLQFYEAQITLLRASLIFPEASFMKEVNKHGPQLHNMSRLLQSQNTCVEAARSIITQMVEYADCHPHFMLITPTPTWLGAVTLALHTFKKPHKRMGRSDGELVRTASDYVADCYRRVGQHEKFIRGVMELSKRMNHVLSGDNISVDPVLRATTQELQDRHFLQNDLSTSQFYDACMEPFALDPTEHFQDPFQLMPLDQFWTVMEGEFATIGGEHGFP